jgi:hypothetical protein
LSKKDGEKENAVNGMLAAGYWNITPDGRENNTLPLTAETPTGETSKL